MLVFTRYIGEEVVIGTDVTVKVLDVDGRRVRLGFTAPADVVIDRREVRTVRERARATEKPA